MIEDASANTVSPRYQALRSRLAVHPLYGALCSIAALRVFMEHHVYAVWDFMSLIKTLQAQFAPSSIPWKPPDNPRLAHLINQLVLEEESDHALADSSGHAFASHFESYCRAMSEIGADIISITHFIHQSRRDGLMVAMQMADVPEPAKRFMRFTFEIIRHGQPHQIAAVLAYGRESLVPRMFQSILAGLQIGPQAAPVLHRYLHRHVELDGGEHGPLAVRLVADLCGCDASKRQEAMDSATEALQARLDFWDGIYQAISIRQDTPIIQAVIAESSPH